MFAVPVDEIPAVNPNMGFGGKTEKFKPEVPYKLKILAVGGPRPFNDNVWFEAEVKAGDIVSHVQTNATLREKMATTGFILDGQQIMVMDFQDIVGIWQPQKR